MGARGSPFPAGFGLGLGLRLWLPGLGSSSSVLRGFGHTVCDLVFIPRRQPSLLCAPGLGFTRGLELEEWGPEEWRSQMGGRKSGRKREKKRAHAREVEDDLTAELSTSRGPKSVTSAGH